MLLTTVLLALSTLYPSSFGNCETIVWATGERDDSGRLWIVDEAADGEGEDSDEA